MQGCLHTDDEVTAMTHQDFTSLLENNERTWLDWKSDFPGQLVTGKGHQTVWEEGRGTLLKDLASIANGDDEAEGYLVYGVKDHGPYREITGFSPSVQLDDADFHTWVQNCFDPPISFRYSRLDPEASKLVGIFTVSRTPDYPHVVRQSVGAVIHEGQVWFRQGSKNSVAMRGDLERMFRGAEPFKVGRMEDPELKKVEEHYRAAGFTPVLPGLYDKDSLLRQGYRIAYLPGTRREVWVGYLRTTDSYELILMLKPGSPG
jgi:hypothetical protein